VRLNRHWLGQTCSGRRAFVAIALLMTFGAVALTRAAKPQIAHDSNPSRFFASNPNPPGHATQSVMAAYGHLPLMFEPNQGQSDPRVKFLARGSGYGLYLTADEAVLTLQHSTSRPQHSAQPISVVRMRLAGTSAPALVSGTDELPGKSNYLIGNDPAKWHRNIPQFARVRYHDVYPGIDLIYYGSQGQLEYDFEIAPGHDPRQVALKFQGSENLTIDASGDLVLGIGGSDIQLHAPRVYQRFGAEQRTVAGRFALRGNGKDEVGFELGAYDRDRTLIIDPILTYSTYLGGSGIESCSAITGLPFTPGCPAIAVDAVSSAYVAGSTTSTDFPPQPGVMGSLTGTANLFIAKFSPAGNALQFATYLGGNAVDYTAGIAVDNGFNVIVAGTTTSSDFPTDGTNAAFQTPPVSAGKHVFVSKLDSTGHTLLYSTYLAGSGADVASGLALDPGGNAYVTGTSSSPLFPVSGGFPTTVGAYQPAPKAINQFFMSKVNPNASGSASLPYSTYVGGSSPASGVTVGGGIAVDSTSNAYITGGTTFTDMPVLNAFQGTNKGGLDVFVTRINPAGAEGTQLVYSTYLGGTGDDVGYGVAVDSSTNAYVTGSTSSGDFNVGGASTTPELQAKNLGGVDAFLAKLGVACVPTPTTTCNTPLPLSYFTYLGGSGTDIGTAVAVDGSQGARITGLTSSPDFPVLNPVQTAFGGGTSDAFVARIDTLATCSPILTPPPACPATSSSSFFGGAAADMGTGIAVDQQSSTYLAGETFSPASSFPLANSFQPQLNGTSDAFVSKLGPRLNLTMLTPAVAPSPVGVGGQVTFTYTITNNGDFTNNITFTNNLPVSGATFVSATASPGTCGQPTGTPPTVQCNIGALNTAATATGTVVVSAVAPPTAGGSVLLGNSGTAGVNGSTLATAGASVVVNDFSLQVGPPTAIVPAGVPATFTATVAPSANNGFPGSVSVSCTSALPIGATCLPGANNPVPNLNTGAQSVQLVINTTVRVTTTTRLHGLEDTPFYALFLPVSGLALLGVGLGGRVSRKRRLLTALLLGGLFALILFQPACGSKSHTSITSGTPAGTYPVTISATSGTNAVRTALVTLTVQ
jgi:uncharacterized repeat protein (TIGR01451 family)